MLTKITLAVMLLVAFVVWCALHVGTRYDKDDFEPPDDNDWRGYV